MKKTLLFASLMSVLAVTGCSSTGGSDASAASTAIVNVSSNGHDKNHEARNAVDGSLKTRWAQRDEAWIQFDFDGEQTLSHVQVAAFKGDERKQKFDLEVSMDGKTWTTALKETATSGTTKELERFEFAPVKAKYARINGYGTDVSKSWTGITEVQF
ncbi:discoidin domain-containing protein [Vibrio ziniensis]|uniref:Discoidin domain-containing protein n=1 Tax=Vibrio ziniensis TaxID=2711221 RepID=A0A6G7CF24_9VIBR|nr:discoidin domain-containing protein [Vibrio ziniensis]QIH40648.1 discoidin domain-containing protein [Vibrio ziniensis]